MLYELPEDVDDPDFTAESIGDYISDELSLVGKGFQNLQFSTLCEAESSHAYVKQVRETFQSYQDTTIGSSRKYGAVSFGALCLSSRE
jgi:hypothetical protein